MRINNVKKRVERVLSVFDRDTESTFGRIYNLGLWGSNSTFDSGAGSGIGGEVYSALVHRYVNTFKKPVTILDLGCGDFRIGKQLVSDNINYIGVDVVHKLIKHNREKYQSSNISFYQADIINDNLPKADICLVRQVLQHLSLENIHKILEKLNYPVTLITEHHTSGLPNQEKVDGFLIRDGGIHLDLPPFSLDAEVVLNMPHNGWGNLVTYRLNA